MSNQIVKAPASTVFVKEMVKRAEAVGVKPHEMLGAMAIDLDIELPDCYFDPKTGTLQRFNRPLTLAERQQALAVSAPYFAAKVATEVKQSGTIQIEHVLQRSPLDAITIDDQGNAFDPGSAEDISFDDVDD